MKIKMTWDNLLSIGLVLVVCFLVFRTCTRETAPDYSGYIKEFNELQNTVDSSVSRIERLDSEFDSINQNLNKKYEAIDTANVDELRGLFNEYFSARK